MDRSVDETMNDGETIDNTMIEEHIIDLDKTIIDSLQVANIKHEEDQQPNLERLQFQNLNQLSLIQQTGISAHEILKSIGNKNIQNTFISSGVKEIDSLLRNGVRTGIITEIYGPDGSCKTSLALQFALNAILSEQGDEKVYSLYLSTTKKPHQQRINQIIEGIKQRNGNLTDQKIKNDIDQFVEVYVPQIMKFKEFMDGQLKEYYLKLKTIRVIVVDNIYDLASQVEDYKEKQEFLFKVINVFKKFAHENSTAVIIVNNVVASFNDNPTSNLYPSSSSVIPALGNYWTHLLNERLHLNLLNEVLPNTTIKIRTLSIKLSPRLPLDKIKIIPDNFGISFVG